jgi:hypothetical protein
MLMKRRRRRRKRIFERYCMREKHNTTQHNTHTPVEFVCGKFAVSVVDDVGVDDRDRDGDVVGVNDEEEMEEVSGDDSEGDVVEVDDVLGTENGDEIGSVGGDEEVKGEGAFGTENGDETGGGGGGGGNSKISTTFVYPLLFTIQTTSKEDFVLRGC